MIGMALYIIVLAYTLFASCAFGYMGFDDFRTCKMIGDSNWGALKDAGAEIVGSISLFSLFLYLLCYLILQL